HDYTGENLVQRDLMLIKVAAPPEKRPEIQSVIEMFRAKVVDIGPKFIMVEVTGPEQKIEAFIDMCRPYGVKDIVRTGMIAMPRHPKNRPGSQKLDVG
ncbi:MAG: acetolactate synthase small subunit, partial [Sedimentisphaerales bacterium]|nr:acetolactate synthase small subunit [Sedimentisphaerales bacterium]